MILGTYSLNRVDLDLVIRHHLHHHIVQAEHNHRIKLHQPVRQDKPHENFPRQT